MTSHDRALQMLRSQNASVESISCLTGIPGTDILPLWGFSNAVVSGTALS
jgi:hypothetical protein